MSHEEFINELNKIKLKKLEKVSLGELLATTYFERKGIGIIGLLKSLLASMLLEGNNYYVYGDIKIWLIATYSYYRRPDLQHQFENATKCLKHKGIIIPQRKFSLHIKRLSLFPLILCWNKQLKKTKFNKNIRKRMISEIFKAFIIAGEAVDIIRRKGGTKLCVTFCDVHPPDYLITFMLNKCGIKTATLQHGVYDHISRYEFTNSHSDYFLAINEHAKEEAILSGLDRKKIHVLGLLSYIDEEPKARTFVKRDGVYGILLNGARDEILGGEDKKLLDFGYELSAKKNFNVIVRPHPFCNVPEHAIKNLDQYRECPENLQLKDFLSQCDFVLTGSTTAYIDSFIFGCPAYRYIGIRDFFPKVEKHRFCDVNQLREELIDYYTQNEEGLLKEIQTVREYFIPNGSVKENYKLFFKEFCV